METIGECVGGLADGVQLNCPDPDEPNDWPDSFVMAAKETDAFDRYERRVGKDGVQQLPRVVKGKRVVYFDVVP